jgi:hypothetical protein
MDGIENELMFPNSGAYTGENSSAKGELTAFSFWQEMSWQNGAELRLQSPAISPFYASIHTFFTGHAW